MSWKARPRKEVGVAGSDQNGGPRTIALTERAAPSPFLWSLLGSQRQGLTGWANAEELQLVVDVSVSRGFFQFGF